MSLAFTGRSCEVYNESGAEPCAAVGAGKVITVIKELADQC